MILVKSKTGASNIHGVGLIASAPIPKSTRVWELTPGFDLILSESEVSKLSLPAREQFLNYAYTGKTSGNYILCSDDARFMNHDANPNITCQAVPESSVTDDLVCFANRDISEGEEITCDYREFDANPTDVIIE